MKVLMPVLHYKPVIGGLETWTQNIAEGIAKNVKVFVVTGKVKNQAQKEVLNQVSITRTSLLSLDNLSHSSLIYIITTLPFIFFRSLSFIKKEKISILHCQSFLSGFIGYLLSKLTKIPYIVTVQRLEQSKSFLRRLVYNNAKVCIAASSKIKDYFESIDCKNIVVIPNGIDLKRFQNLDRGANRKKLGLKDEFIIITVARLEKVKGIKYLIKALVSLNNKFQSSNVKYKLLIVGDGSEKRNLENLTEKFNLQNRVKFLGQVPNERISGYLSVADCFILPSLSEGFGIVILEAMASKLSIIATRVGGLLDLIEHEKTGILVEPKNPEQISSALFKLYSQPELSQQLANMAFLNLDKYNWDNIVERVYEIYKKLSL